MFMNSVFSNKKMLIFQFIVLFSSFEYYAKHPILDTITSYIFIKRSVFLEEGRGRLFDWDYNYYKNATVQVRNAFNNILDHPNFINKQRDIFENRTQPRVYKDPNRYDFLEWYNGNWEQKRYNSYLMEVYDRNIKDFPKNGANVADKIYPYESNMTGKRTFQQNLFNRYKNRSQLLEVCPTVCN